MKHRISAVIACILAGVLLTACSLESAKTEEKTLPKITIGGAIYKPYFYKDVEENYTGIDVELAKEACARLGYRPVFKEIDLDSERSCCRVGRSIVCGAVLALMTIMMIICGQDRIFTAAVLLWYGETVM